MATSKLFKKVPLTAPNRSGFNMSHNNFFSAPVGTLVPNLIDFLIPGDEIDLSSKSHVQLPPMATDFYGRIEYKEEAFFVPCRILFGGWKDFFVNPVDGTTNPSNIEGQLAKYLIGAKVSNITPYITKSETIKDDGTTNSNAEQFYEFVSQFYYDILSRLQVSIDNNELISWLQPNNPNYSSESPVTDIGAGSLLDYLGFKVSSGSVTTSNMLDLQYELASNLGALDTDLFDSVNNLINGSTTTAVKLGSATASNNMVTVSINFWGYHYQGDDFSTHVDFTIIANGGDDDISINNILPLMAYHKIYDDWYRSPQIQQSLFKRNVANSSTATSVANMPWITSGAEDKVYLTGVQLQFANGHNLFDLHQRNWQKDFFTSMTPEPQAGDASSVKFDIVDDSGEFTIASLRAANALQQWLDRNNIGGFRYGDMIYAQYGVYPSDAITDRAIYLGSSSTEVYNKSIYQQSGDGGQNTNNPFNAIGSKYSNPTGVGQGSFCNNYRVTEAGFVVKIGSLVPQAYYSTGVRRMFHYNDISDIAFPVLAGVGDQEVYARELVDVYSGEGNKDVVGYQQRYAEYKFIDDQVHGKLRDGESLASFALQRSFSTVPQLGSEFLQIPRDYLDQVSATDYKLSKYGCWVNCYNDYRKSSTLPAYSIPTLEDMKGHTILVDKGGNYIA